MSDPTSKSAIQRAVDIVGSQSLLASNVGVTQGRVWQWCNGDRVPAERCADIERATDGAVTRYDLRPDVFGPAPQGQEAA